jgi:ribonucleotide reductase alpha subunit
MPTKSGHAQRLYDYMSRLWFMPATPILSNGGTKRGPADLLLPQ